MRFNRIGCKWQTDCVSVRYLQLAFLGLLCLNSVKRVVCRIGKNRAGFSESHLDLCYNSVKRSFAALGKTVPVFQNRTLIYDAIASNGSFAALGDL